MRNSVQKPNEIIIVNQREHNISWRLIWTLIQYFIWKTKLSYTSWLMIYNLDSRYRKILTNACKTFVNKNNNISESSNYKTK